MRLTEHISLVASGSNGLRLTHPLDCNAYLVDCGGGLLLVDAGVGLDTPAILAQIRADGYRPEDIRWVVLTHAHADHVAGAAEIAALSGAQILADRHEAQTLADEPLLTRTMAQYVAAGFYPEGYRFKPVTVDRVLEDDETLTLGNLSVQVLVTPGHSGGGICLLAQIDGRSTLFSGDVVFWNGSINLISIFDVDLACYKQSVLRLAQLRPERLLAGHLQPVMRQGWMDIALAAEPFRRFSVPKSLC